MPFPRPSPERVGIDVHYVTRQEPLSQLPMTTCGKVVYAKGSYLAEFYGVPRLAAHPSNITCVICWSALPPPLLLAAMPRTSAPPAPPTIDSVEPAREMRSIQHQRLVAIRHRQVQERLEKQRRQSERRQRVQEAAQERALRSSGDVKKCVSCSRYKPDSAWFGVPACTLCLDSMLDLVRSAQPTRDAVSSQHLVVYDGRLFDRRKLRAGGRNLGLLLVLNRIRTEMRDMLPRVIDFTLETTERWHNWPKRKMRPGEENQLPRGWSFEPKSSLVHHILTPLRLYSGLNTTSLGRKRRGLPSGD